MVKEKNKKVWVNGTFDVLHIGHLGLLEFASNFGRVTVGIDSDRRVKEIKGESRPFNCLEYRKKFLDSIKFVQEVVSFDSREELEKLIKDFQPDYLVIGDEYRDKEIIGSSYSKNIIFFEKLPNISTTKILDYGKS